MEGKSLVVVEQPQNVQTASVLIIEQLYAQVLYEIRELGIPYWFNNGEVARIQQLNLAYMQQKDIAEMVKACFRKPADGDKV